MTLKIDYYSQRNFKKIITMCVCVCNKYLLSNNKFIYKYVI